MLKKLTRGLLALCLLAGMVVAHKGVFAQADGVCIAAPPPHLTIGEYAIVQENAGTRLNVRDIPSTYGGIIGELSAGNVVQVLEGYVCGERNDLFAWWRISAEDGLTGWVAEGDSFRTEAQYFLAPPAESNVTPGLVACEAAPPSRVRVGSFAVVSEANGASLVIRDSPSGRLLDYLRIGSIMEIIGGSECGDTFKWWQVSTEDGLIGWVAEGDATQNLYFIDPLEESEAADFREAINPNCLASPPTILRAGDVVEVADVGGFPLSLRNNPAGSRIGELQQGTRLEILDGPRCGNYYAWWQVVLEDGQTGWVAEGDSTQTPVAYFIRLVTEEDSAAAGAEFAASADVSADSAPEGNASECQASPPQQLQVGDPAIILDVPSLLRNAPSLAGQVVDKLEPETYVIILNGPRCGDGNKLYSWWEVRSERGAVGWIQEGDAAQSPPVYYVVPLNYGLED